MKKIFSVLLILSLVFCLVACGEKDLPLENEIDLPSEDEIVSDSQVSKKYIDESLLEQYSETQIIKLPENDLLVDYTIVTEYLGKKEEVTLCITIPGKNK